MFAITIPIIIHLINFRRHKILYFSNTRFLENIKKETKTRTKLKQILILIARIFTIAALVFAFAGPFIPIKKGLNEKLNEINAIYLDNSFSMENKGKKGVLFEQAQKFAQEIAYSSTNSTKYLLITNDLLPEHQHLTDKNEFIININKTSISPSSLSLNDAILKANNIIPKNRNANLYIISDMQKPFLDNIKASLNDNISLIFVPISAENFNNIYIDSVWFKSPVHRLNMSEKLVARIVNNSKEAFFEQSLQLFINDSLKAVAGFSIEENEIKEIEIEYVNTQPNYINAKLEISDYPITYDNTLFFNYYVSENTKILIINNEKNNIWISSLYDSDPENFKLSQVKAGNEQNETFNNYELIVLNSFSQISSGLTENLLAYVKKGGSVLFIPSNEINTSSINKFLKLFNVGNFEEKKFFNIKINSIEYAHDIFNNVFLNKEKQSDLPNIGAAYKFTQYSSSTLVPIIKLENNAGLLFAGNFEAGKIYIISAPLTEINSEFMKSAVFLPAFYNMAINSQINNQLYSIIKAGANVEINNDTEIVSSDIFKISDRENFEFIVSHKYFNNRIIIDIPQQILNSGTYSLFKSEEFIAPISLNYNRIESVFEFADNNELEKLLVDKFNNKGKVINTNKGNLSAELKKFSEGKPLWQLFILLAFIFICFEVVFARFLK